MAPLSSSQINSSAHGETLDGDVAPAVVGERERRSEPMRKLFTRDDPMVPVHHPRVIIETAVLRGVDRSVMLASASLTEEILQSPDARISHRQYGAIIEKAMEATGDPSLGLEVGKHLRPPQMGALGLGLMSSATVGQALELAIKHGPALSPALRLRLEGDEGTARLIVDEVLPLHAFLVFATDMLLSAVDTQGRLLFGGPLPVKALRFAFPEPQHSARYKDFYDVPLFFDQDVTAVDFDANLLRAPVGFADPATAKIAERIVAETLQTPADKTDVVARTRRILDGSSAEPPNLERVAKALQVSGRTLRRNLKRVGTSYQRILDEWRRERADEWLSTTHLSQQQMAEKLGFSDVRSFRRAYKRWTGQSPSSPRARKQ